MLEIVSKFGADNVIFSSIELGKRTWQQEECCLRCEIFNNMNGCSTGQRARSRPFFNNVFVADGVSDDFIVLWRILLLLRIQKAPYDIDVSYRVHTELRRRAYEYSRGKNLWLQE